MFDVVKIYISELKAVAKTLIVPLLDIKEGFVLQKPLRVFENVNYTKTFRKSIKTTRNSHQEKHLSIIFPSRRKAYHREHKLLQFAFQVGQSGRELNPSQDRATAYRTPDAECNMLANSFFIQLQQNIMREVS